MALYNQMTLGRLKAEIDVILAQGLSADTPVSVLDNKGNVKRIHMDSFAYNHQFGIYVKFLKEK